MPLLTAQTCQLFRNSCNIHPLTLKWLSESKLAGCPVLKSKSKIGKGGMGGGAYSRPRRHLEGMNPTSLSQAQARVSHSAPPIVTILRPTCYPQSLLRASTPDTLAAGQGRLALQPQVTSHPLQLQHRTLGTALGGREHP